MFRIDSFEYFLKLYLLFWFFSFLGWIIEIIVCSVKDKRLVNRGFLIGPYCPIYGFGALIMLLVSPYKDNILICFTMSLVFCSILEYFTSFLMERLFKVHWWDYSNDAFNINGRVCLRNAIAFGSLGVIFAKLLSPWYFSLINKLNYQTLLIISIIVFIITLIDIIISYNAISSIKNILNKDLLKYKNKDVTNDIKKMVSEYLLNYNIFQKRLIKTYHLLDKEKKYIMKTIKIVNEKTKKGYGLFLGFVIIGLLIGLILSLVFKVDRLSVILPFTLTISSLIAAIILKVGDK